MREVSSATVVGIGSRVIVRTTRDQIRSLTIVEGPGDPERGIVSQQAPLARSCLGHKEGDQVSFFHNGQVVMVTILAVVE